MRRAARLELVEMGAGATSETQDIVDCVVEPFFDELLEAVVDSLHVSQPL